MKFRRGLVLDGHIFIGWKFQGRPFRLTWSKRLSAFPGFHAPHLSPHAALIQNSSSVWARPAERACQLNRDLGAESSSEIVLFGFYAGTCACASDCYVGFDSTFEVPFLCSFWRTSNLRFPLAYWQGALPVPLSNRNIIEMNPKWDRSEIEVQPKWDRSEIDLETKWNPSETERNQQNNNVATKSIRSAVGANSKISSSETETTSNCNQI